LSEDGGFRPGPVALRNEYLLGFLLNLRSKTFALINIVSTGYIKLTDSESRGFSTNPPPDSSREGFTMVSTTVRSIKMCLKILPPFTVFIIVNFYISSGNDFHSFRYIRQANV
jgi:hypothetical protein